MKNLNDIAKSLYDSGWRCEDLYSIMDEYEMTYEDARNICEDLKELEDSEVNEWYNNNKDSIEEVIENEICEEMGKDADLIQEVDGIPAYTFKY